jgi:hypothetical protein
MSYSFVWSSDSFDYLPTRDSRLAWGAAVVGCRVFVSAGSACLALTAVSFVAIYGFLLAIDLRILLALACVAWHLRCEVIGLAMLSCVVVWTRLTIDFR